MQKWRKLSTGRAGTTRKRSSSGLLAVEKAPCKRRGAWQIRARARVLRTHRSTVAGPRATRTEPIDRPYLARFTLGNAALEREVLELFASQTPLYIQQLRSAATRQAWKDAVHAIKGSASAIGAWRLASLAQLAGQLNVEACGAVYDHHREQTIAAVAAGADEACRHIACLFATA